MARRNSQFVIPISQVQIVLNNSKSDDDSAELEQLVTRFLHPSKIVYTFLGVRGQSKPSLVWPHSYVGQLFGPLGALGSAASADHVAVPNQIKIRHWTLDIGPTWWIFATRSLTSKIAWRIGVYCSQSRHLALSNPEVAIVALLYD
jgi:hypothetical protein